MLNLAIVVISSISDEQDTDVKGENRKVQQKEDDGSKGSLQESNGLVMMICLMPLNCCWYTIIIIMNVERIEVNRVNPSIFSYS